MNDIAENTISETTFNPAEMLVAMRNISAILQEEITLLQDMKIADIHKFYEDKITLTAILEDFKAIIKNNPEILNSIPERTLADLRKEAVKFETLVEEDNKQIARATEVHKLVMKALKKTLNENIVKSSGYNKKGFIDPGYKGFTNITPPISVNQNF